MFRVLILVCSMNLAPQDCEIKNAIHVIAGPLVSSERSCRLSGNAFVVSTTMAPTDREYVTIRCRRRSSAEARTDPSDRPPVD
jgi:hypothetical protein